MKPQIFDYIIEEAQLTGLTHEEVLAKYRKKMKEDTDQGCYDLYQEALLLLQEAAQDEIDDWEEALNEAISEGASVEDFETKPPFPIAIQKYEVISFRTGFKGTTQELGVVVLCDDDNEYYMEWFSVLDTEYDSVDSELKWTLQRKNSSVS